MVFQSKLRERHLYKASAKLPIKTKTIKRYTIMKKKEIKKLTKGRSFKEY